MCKKSRREKQKLTIRSSPVVEYHGPRRLPILKLLARARLQLWNGVRCRLEGIPLLYHHPFRLFERVVHVGRSQQNLQQSPDPRLLRGPYSLQMVELRALQCSGRQLHHQYEGASRVTVVSHRCENARTGATICLRREGSCPPQCKIDNRVFIKFKRKRQL